MAEESDFIIVPNSIELKIGEDGVNCTKFHPTKDLLAIGTEEGRIRLYDCATEDPKLQYRKRWHKSCLSMNFSGSGAHLATASAQGALKVHDTETGQSVFSSLMAHTCPILALVPLEEKRYVTGDENGCIKIWDTRTPTSNEALSICLVGEDPIEGETEDNIGNKQEVGHMTAINDFAVGPDNKLLLVAMDDGTLTTVNIRRRRRELKSEWLGFSAKAVTIVKENKKVLVGTDEGVISMFGWEEFGNICDRFPVVKTTCRGDIAIENMVKVTDDVVCIATEDGFIRVVNVLPNRVFDPLGCHLDDSGKTGGDCLSMTVNQAGTLLASGCPASSSVRFWCVERLAEVSRQEEENLKKTKSKRKKSADLPARKVMRLETRPDWDFFSDLLMPSTSNIVASGAQTSDSDDDCDSDNEGNNDSEDDSDSDTDS